MSDQELREAAHNYMQAVNAWIGCEASSINFNGRYWQRLQLSAARLNNAMVDPEIRAEKDRDDEILREHDAEHDVEQVVEQVMETIGNVAERLKAFVSKTNKL